MTTVVKWSGNTAFVNKDSTACEKFFKKLDKDGDQKITADEVRGKEDFCKEWMQSSSVGVKLEGKLKSLIEASKRGDSSDAVSIKFKITYTPDKLYEQAESLLKRGETGAAVDKLNKILQLRPKDHKAYSKLGYIHYSRDDYKKAAEYFQKSMKCGGDAGELSVMLDYAKGIPNEDSANKAFSSGVLTTINNTSDLDELDNLEFQIGKFEDQKLITSSQRRHLVGVLKNRKTFLFSSKIKSLEKADTIFDKVIDKLGDKLSEKVKEQVYKKLGEAGTILKKSLGVIELVTDTRELVEKADKSLAKLNKDPNDLKAAYEYVSSMSDLLGKIPGLGKYADLITATSKAMFATIQANFERIDNAIADIDRHVFKPIEH